VERVDIKKIWIPANYQKAGGSVRGAFGSAKTKILRKYRLDFQKLREYPGMEKCLLIHPAPREIEVRSKLVGNNDILWTDYFLSDLNVLCQKIQALNS
jgi:hypothetical protein